VKELLAREDRLATPNRVLLSELALGASDFALARRQLERALAETPSDRHARLLRARALLGQQEVREAEAEARKLWEERRADEAAATMVAECLALRERFDEAQAVLADAALPAQPAVERGLLAALIAFEREGLHRGLAQLGRVPPPPASAPQAPLVRVLAAAFPNAWAAPRVEEPARREDLFHLPPFPNLALRIAEALSTHGKDDLAAALLTAVARVAEARGDQAHARQLRLRAVPALARSGARGEALREAWRARSVGSALTALFAR
jgi:hypothetical protein